MKTLLNYNGLFYCIIRRGSRNCSADSLSLSIFPDTSRKKAYQKGDNSINQDTSTKSLYHKGNTHTERSTANHTSKSHDLNNDQSNFKMAGGLPIYRPASTLPTLPEVPDPAIVSLEQALDHEVTTWAQIRAQASQRYQEYQDEKKREQERAEEELLILGEYQEAEENAQAEDEATCTGATTFAVGVPITLSWEREIEEWARIRAQAIERYRDHQLEREREQEREGEQEKEREQKREGEQEREKEQDLAEHDEHLPILHQRQVAKRNSKLRMIHNWLNNIHI